MLLIRERLVVALPKGHRAARKRYVGLRDLEGELLIMPSSTFFSSLSRIRTACRYPHRPNSRSRIKPLWCISYHLYQSSNLQLLVVAGKSKSTQHRPSVPIMRPAWGAFSMWEAHFPKREPAVMCSLPAKMGIYRPFPPDRSLANCMDKRPADWLGSPSVGFL